MSIEHAEVPTTEAAVRLVASFAQSQLESSGRQFVNLDDYGQQADVTEARLAQLANGAILSFQSVAPTEPTADFPPFLSMRVHDTDEWALTIHDDYTFSWDKGDPDVDGFEYYSVPRDEAIENPDFLEVLDHFRQIITEEVPKKEKPFEERPLPASMIIMPPSPESEKTTHIDAGFIQRARNFGEEGEKGQKPSQDAALVDAPNMLFGVFDGVGSLESSHTASRLAAVSVQERMAYYSSYGADDPESVRFDLADSLAFAHNEILRWARGLGHVNFVGDTTATVAKIVEAHDGTYLVWASVGDSRLYLKNSPDKDMVQVSEDEGLNEPGLRHIITNSLGHGFKGVKQSGVIPIEHQSSIVLVTDGITGDTDIDMLSVEDVERAVNRSPTAMAAAEQLLHDSRKKDDKTAIVVGYP